MNFLPYNQKENKTIKTNNDSFIASFISKLDDNIDENTVDSFGEEWTKFDSFTAEEIKNAGDQYFDIVSDDLLTKETTVLDMGCGSGRWTKYIAKKVKLVEAIDPSSAVYSASELNKDEKNVRVSLASVSNIPFDDHTFDFVICLGVLHHIPDTQKALSDVVKKISKGGHLLLYLYYSLDNRSKGYKTLFNISTIFRLLISKMPHVLKKITCDIIALLVYWPLVMTARVSYFVFGNKSWIKKIPLSYYSDKSFNIIRNDALDRFGTPLEQRFSKSEIGSMLKKAGITSMKFSENEPYWHVLAFK